MGIIQNAINQTLQTAGIAARLSPEYETKAELGRLKRKEKLLDLQQQELPSISSEELAQGKTYAAQEYQRLQAERASLTQRRFELKPSRKTMLQSTIESEKPVASIPADPEEIARERAMEQAAQTQDRQQKQQEAFKNYITNLETSLGSKVGDLPGHVQALIMQQLQEEDNKKDGE